MSRTRIVKGKITEIIAKDYNIYSESSIVDNATEMITDKGVAKGESYGNPEKPSAGEILAKCMVQFRPHNGWTGEYGFDWVRVADTGQIGDKKWYRDIMGKYVDKTDGRGNVDYCNPKFVNQVSSYDKLINEFKKYSVPWKSAGSHPYYYIIPYLSLLPKNSAKLNLKIEIKDSPDRFELSFNSDFIDVKFVNELSVEVGKREIQEGIEIYCKKEFNSDQIIEIFAVKGDKRDSVGQIIIVKNAKQFRREVIITLIKVFRGRKTVKIENEFDFLKKIFKQSYVELKIQTTSIKVNENIDISKMFDQSEFQTFDFLNNLLRKSKNSNGHPNDRFFDNSFRIFYLPDLYFLDNCGGGYMLGYSERLPKNPIGKGGTKSSILVFNHEETAAKTSKKLLKDKSTSSHELLHAIGLSHTFDNDSKYVFEQYCTDNIMDYRSRESAIIPKQTHKWQWDLIKKQLK